VFWSGFWLYLEVVEKEKEEKTGYDTQQTSNTKNLEPCWKELLT